MTTGHQQPAQDDWERRQHDLGDVPRAVLMKGVPDALNDSIDCWHRTVLRMALEGRTKGSAPMLDLGCGYGRLAAQARSIGIDSIIGVDFSIGFCRCFAAAHGAAVRADAGRLPFAKNAFGNAYAITVLMYLRTPEAREALQSLDACLAPGARVLLLEPGAEFNRVARFFLRHKRNEPLARPGFTDTEFHTTLIPAGWQRIGRGANPWMTLALPLLIATSRMPRLYRAIAAAVLYLDRPRLRDPGRYFSRYALYRWAVYETASAIAG